MRRDAAREAERWRLLVRVRDLRVRRRLRALADARRRERRAADAVTEREVALRQHAAQRLRVLSFCRHEGLDRSDPRAVGRWRATLRVHDGRLPELHRHLEDARRIYAAKRDEAACALRDWQVEHSRHEDAKRRRQMAVRAAWK